jgi:3-methyladenine DNA glycosylase AlkC
MILLKATISLLSHIAQAAGSKDSATRIREALDLYTQMSLANSNKELLVAISKFLYNSVDTMEREEVTMIKHMCKSVVAKIEMLEEEEYDLIGMQYA